LGVRESNGVYHPGATIEILACSGPGAGNVIADNIHTGYIHAGYAGMMLLASIILCFLGPRSLRIPAALLFLLVLHPAWTISAMGGDCGFMKRNASWVFTATGMVVVVWQTGKLLAHHRRREA
jgi:hypothetical protein